MKRLPHILGCILLIITSFSCQIGTDEPIGNDLLEGEIRNFEMNPDSVGYKYLEPAYGNISSSYLLGMNWILQEVTSDEASPLGLGPGWGTEDRWKSLVEHDFSADQDDFRFLWEQLADAKSAMINSHRVFDEAQTSTAIELIIAERDIFESYIDWLFIDHFGQLPDVNPEDNLGKVYKRPEATARVIERLENATEKAGDKSQFTGKSALFRMNKWSGKALLARLYLNKFIYEGQTQATPSDMDKVITLADEIIQSGDYTLSSNYWDIFNNDNIQNPEGVSELLFTTKDIFNQAQTNQFALSTLNSGHFFQQSGWQSYVAISEFYDNWDKDDPRFFGPRIPQVQANFGFNAGLQLDNNGDTLKDAAGNPINYFVNFDDLEAGVFAGARPLKYEPFLLSLAIEPFGGKNAFAIIRLGEVYLMKAEALYRKGETAAALAQINELRQARQAKTLTQLDEKALLDEYGFELWFEGQRRTHQIRFDQYNKAISLRPSGSDPSRKLFPIPRRTLDSQPELEQNPGY
ncbi:MAG: RagB/SusD family nutrient uptake outer membrane protein [Bacteroidia bacterium]|nr:RagB/SusD family nutrient uptake outer membrane protein [Bacteroidia bacterium]